MSEDYRRRMAYEYDQMKRGEPKNLEKVFLAMSRAGKTGVASEMRGVFTSMGMASAGFAALGVVLKAFEPIIKVLSTLFDVFAAGLMKGLMPAIKPLIPILVKMAPLLELLGTLFGWFIRIGLTPLALVVYAIGVAIASVVDFITGILSLLTGGLIQHTTWLAQWNSLMLPLIGSMFSPPSFQTGTGTGGVPSTGLYMLHQGEQVSSQAESKLSRLKQEWHMERQTIALEKLVAYKEGYI